MAEQTDYSALILPPELMWYEEMGGQRTGWVCDVNGVGWWHVSELDLSNELPQRVLHCWKDRIEDSEERFGFGSDEWAAAFLENGTCMLPAGHDGPHEFTPDAQIGITFIDPAEHAHA